MQIVVLVKSNIVSDRRQCHVCIETLYIAVINMQCFIFDFIYVIIK